MVMIRENFCWHTPQPMGDNLTYFPVCEAWFQAPYVHIGHKMLVLFTFFHLIYD